MFHPLSSQMCVQLFNGKPQATALCLHIHHQGSPSTVACGLPLNEPLSHFPLSALRLHELRSPHSGLDLGCFAVGGKRRGDGSAK